MCTPGKEVRKSLGHNVETLYCFTDQSVFSVSKEHAVFACSVRVSRMGRYNTRLLQRVVSDWGRKLTNGLTADETGTSIMSFDWYYCIFTTDKTTNPSTSVTVTVYGV